MEKANTKFDKKNNPKEKPSFCELFRADAKKKVKKKLISREDMRSSVILCGGVFSHKIFERSGKTVWSADTEKI